MQLIEKEKKNEKDTNKPKVFKMQYNKINQDFLQFRQFTLYKN